MRVGHFDSRQRAAAARLHPSVPCVQVSRGRPPAHPEGPAIAISTRDILATITPLRLVFWGGLICLLDLRFAEVTNGHGWRLDLISDAVGAVMIAWGVCGLSTLRAGDWYRNAMDFVLTIACLAVLVALHDHFVYDRPKWLSVALLVYGVLSLIACVVFCMAMRRLSAAAGLEKAERSWKTTTLLFVLLNLIPIGLLHAASFVVILGGESRSFDLPPSFAVFFVALFIPFIHLFVSTSRMVREAAGAGLPMPEFPAR